MTVRELKIMLCAVRRELTVGELVHRLDFIDEQDKEVTLTDIENVTACAEIE